MAREEPSDTAIRIAAVEAAGRRIGPDEPRSNATQAGNLAAEAIIIAASQIQHWIRTGRR